MMHRHAPPAPKPVNQDSRYAQHPFPGDHTPQIEISNAHERETSSAYPAWTNAPNVPLAQEDISDIFIDLTRKFGFQMDSMKNMYDHLMVMLDSRSSRMSPEQALLTLHAEYIGGEDANYRKWYFAAQLDFDEAKKRRRPNRKQVEPPKMVRQQSTATLDVDETSDLAKANYHWEQTMIHTSDFDRTQQLALYLLIWGEASVIRFCPEALCFIFKQAYDHLKGPDTALNTFMAREGSFLDHVITPLYNFIRDEAYEVVDGQFVKRERDHAQVIGYDDVNQLFWYPESIARIVLKDGHTFLYSLPQHRRYLALKDVDWSNVFHKTFLEKRSWMHLFINFTRIWIIHIVAFWYYTAANAAFVYQNSDPTIAAKETPVMYSAVAVGSGIAILFVIFGCIFEYSYVPLTWRSAKVLTRRLIILAILFAINVGPSIYCIGIDRTSRNSWIVSVTQLCISCVTTAYLSIVPMSRLFIFLSGSQSHKKLASQTFTANYPHLQFKERLISIALWFCVFGCKLVESYFFLALSFKDSFQVMYKMRIQNCNDSIIGSSLCTNMPIITLILMMAMYLVLFFLDTYLWYIIWNTVFSIIQSFLLGFSIWTPWQNIFSRLPKRMYSKLVTNTGSTLTLKPKVLCSQIWNAIIISMYREHFLSAEHVQKLLYQLVQNPNDGKRSLKPPTFFTSQHKRDGGEYLPYGSQAERRVHFFAQSLTTPMPEPMPITSMPTFTVLTPHYSEKILLSLREIIREEDPNSRVTLLEYLKQLQPGEWLNFVKDTKTLADEHVIASTDGHSASSSSGSSSTATSETDEKYAGKTHIDDLPFYCVGFKSSAPEYTVRTRIWASQRAQTLYRTVSGFMNYYHAIKLLYRVENPEIVQKYHGDVDGLEAELDSIALRKFKYLVAMQRYSKFTKEEQLSAELLFKKYPSLQVVYLDQEPGKSDKSENVFYSVLTDGSCPLLQDGKRAAKYRIRLPGNPILGDGKSDNQNHALIFYRGEFLQLIDANQDNYLEECLKIRNILSEFENLGISNTSPYSLNADKSVTPPVAIVGAREYIFSENIGVLGDVAAGKEQTFGTLSQRIMAKIGGKLHYGHPDFLNAIFMTTRGGVSKAQKGLHLNEDIYAGINAFARGGRIKHSEYFQCGKGRDLGFGSILNFVTKIGTGMGEQMLSREYYYLGSQLPLDRFLTFYYGHPGFHVNNVCIMMAIQVFMLVMMYIGAISSSVTVCQYNANASPDSPLRPPGCYNLVPVILWIQRCVISVFIVFFIAFLPLFLQELTERGVVRSLIRLGKQLLSLSPFFEVFVTETYTHSILTNLAFGGARYIATGRGFATTRIPFANLYSRFAGPSIYLGSRNFLILLFASLSAWTPYLIYYWFTVVALVFSPFLFNPHQFSYAEFMIDYRSYLRWLSRGNINARSNSWIAYCRISRTQITGYRKKVLGDPGDKLAGDVPRAKFGVIFFSEIVVPLALAFICMVAYLFVRSFNQYDNTLPNQGQSALVRVAIVALGPIVCNVAGLIVIFLLSLAFGWCVDSFFTRFGAYMAALAHTWAVVNLIGIFELLLYLELWKFQNVLLGMIAAMAVQRFIFKVLITVFLTREFRSDDMNQGWWTGKWYGRGLGGQAFTKPLRELLCKTIEMTMFAADFLLGHFILFLLFLFCLIPYIDRVHSLMLFWLRPSKQIRPQILSIKKSKQRRRIVILYSALFVLIFLVMIAAIVVPCILQPQVSLAKFSAIDV
ncbi:unnamed protein product [Umbelopsis ramanniana]